MAGKKPKPSFLDRVNTTQVSPELLGQVMTMYAELDAKDRRVQEVRMFRLFDLLKENGLKGRRHADVATAVEFRLEALAGLLQQRDVRGWTLPAEEGAEYVHFDLLRVAATQPMIESTKNRVAFEPELFRMRVLELAEPKGTA